MSTSPPPHIDPELMRQLKHASPGELVDGVFMLRTPATRAFLNASATRSHVERLLASARKRSGTCDSQLTIFENLQSFALRAPREFVEAVLESPRIASAMANQQPENMLIEPTSPTLPAGNTLASGRSQGNAPRAEETRRSARTATRRPRRTPPAQ